MAFNHVGRHRAPGYNPLNEIADIATRTAQPAMKASAVVVASGGLVASFAIPASASPGIDGAASAASAAGTTAAAPQAVSGALSVAAPALDAGAAPTFGVIGFTATPAATPAPAAVQITKIAPPAPVAAAPVAAAPAATALAATAPAAATTRAARTMTRTAPPAAAPAPAPAAPAAPKPAPAAAPAPTGGITSIAASLSGIPYVYGGTTTRGFDCSGFTGYVYRLAGISIPRVASAQQAAATKVSNPVPGDLVFVGYPAYHVGIYAGPGMMYDAQHPGTVTGLHSIWTSTGVSYGRF